MGRLRLEELRVYALAEDLADQVWQAVLDIEPFAKSTVGHQLVRAADSVDANIAEGFGRASSGDNQRFVRIARGSLYEVRHFLRRAVRRGLLTPERRQVLRTILRDLLPLLNAYLSSLGKHASGSPD